MDERYQLQVRDRLAKMQLEIQQILGAVGDPGRNVRLVAVTKYIGVDEVRDLEQAGITDAGENRWQVARAKVEELPQLQWHFIGPIQRNKARHIARHFKWVHSVDRWELAEDLSKYAQEFGNTLNVLLQVNISGEAQKSGVMPEDVASLLTHCTEFRGIAIKGLMGIATNTDNEDQLRQEFRLLRALRDELQNRFGLHLPELSMGMSEDYPIALEEGATMIRIGRKLVLKEGLAL